MPLSSVVTERRLVFVRKQEGLSLSSGKETPRWSSVRRLESRFTTVPVVVRQMTHRGVSFLGPSGTHPSFSSSLVVYQSSSSTSPKGMEDRSRWKRRLEINTASEEGKTTPGSGRHRFLPIFSCLNDWLARKNRCRSLSALQGWG